MQWQVRLLPAIARHRDIFSKQSRNSTVHLHVHALTRILTRMHIHVHTRTYISTTLCHFQEVFHESLNFFYVNIGLNALNLSFIPE